MHFDVDGTLEVSGGPVSIVSVGSLKAEGHIVGLNGNWAGGSSIGAAVAPHFQLHCPMEMSKDIFLDQLKRTSQHMTTSWSETSKE